MGREKGTGPRTKGRRFLLSLEFQALMTVAVLVDLGAFVVEQVRARRGQAVSTWPLQIHMSTLAVLSLEMIGNVICSGLRGFVRDRWNVFDLIMLALCAALIGGPAPPLCGGLVAARMTRFAEGMLLTLRVFLRLRPLTQAARNKVTNGKMRYVDVENNFDLDLTYIDRHLIAMAVPAGGSPSVGMLVRNSLSEVARFFEANHHGHFRVYNACPELPYPEAPLRRAGGSTLCLQVQDHSPPRMEQLLEFLADARRFRSESQDNVVVVHCMAGKGRTGTLCCAWLLYLRRQATVEQALEFFARRRTDTRFGGRLRGVETPSQVRYVTQVMFTALFFFLQVFQHLQRTDSWFDSPWLPPPVPTPTAILHNLSIDGHFFAHPEKIKGLRVLVQCFDGCSSLTDPLLETASFAPSDLRVTLDDVVVKGDVRISLFDDEGKDFKSREIMFAARENFIDGARGLLASFCFHTAFMHGSAAAPPSSDPPGGRTLRIDASQLDKAHKTVRTETRDGRFSRGAGVDLGFSGGHVAPHGAGARDVAPAERGAACGPRASAPGGSGGTLRAPLLPEAAE
ncbi:unnamed protein product, partial [Prorocentrum cordatum]